MLLNPKGSKPSVVLVDPSKFMGLSEVESGRFSVRDSHPGPWTKLFEGFNTTPGLKLLVT